MRRNRGLYVLLAVGLVLVGVGGARSTLPPEVEELLPHAVLLWLANVLEVPHPLVWFLDVVDLNGDGIPDIVVSHDKGAEVLFGDGAGGFQTGSWAFFDEGKRVPLAYGYLVHPVGDFLGLGGCLADLDGDGYLDLAVIASNLKQSSAPKLFIFRADRHGSLRQVRSSVLPSLATPLGAVDFTGDGRIDLILVTLDEKPARVLLLPGEKAFRFGDPIAIAETHAKPFLLADFNGSGIPDLGVFDTDEVTVFLGDGRGGVLPERLRFSPLGGPIMRCVAGDLTGNGLLDLVVLTRDDDLVVAVQEAGSFTEASRFELKIKAQNIHLCDMDGDGALDLLVEGLYGQRAAVYSGDGTAGFRGPTSEFALFSSGSIIPVDLTGNGRCDLIQAVRPGLFVIYLSETPPRGETRLPTGGSRLLAVGDLSGNGAVDLVAQGAPGVEVFWNAGQGAFVRWPLVREFSRPGPGAEIVVRGEREFEVVRDERRVFWITHREPVAAAVADGILWVLVLRDEQDEWRPWEKRAVAELRGYTAAGEEIASFRLGETVVPLLHSGDLDGDGKQEVVVVKKQEILVFWGDGEPQTHRREEGNLSLFRIGDFSGDGRDEVVLVSADGAHVGLYIVSFVEREVHVRGPVFRFPEGAIPLALATGDIDGDGVVDPVAIAMTLSARKEERVLQIKVSDILLGLVLSRDGPVVVPISEFPEGDAPWPFTGLAVGDFTGDGVTDVAYTTVGAAGVFVLPGRGDGRFGEAAYFRAPVGPLFSADLDHSGRMELLGSMLGLNPALWILWNGGGR